MSARKMKDTKIPEATDQDSGFLSGPIDKLPGDSGEISCELSHEIRSDEKIVPCVKVESCEFDSGLVDLTEDLSSWNLEPHTKVPERCAAPPAITRTSQLPPLDILFQQDDDGDSQLHIAAIHGCEKALGTLIRVCPNKDWLNIPNDEGQTPLHLAALSGNPVVTRMLVKAGASIAVRDRRGETPLHKATVLKNVECIQALLNPLKEIPQRDHTAVLNQKNYNGQACVHLAASAGHVETLRMLLHYGADINCMENLAGWTALHIGAAHGHLALVLWVREKCANANLRPRDYAGRTPRRLARRLPRIASAFADLPDDSEYDSDSDDDMYDSDGESFFEMVRDSLTQPLVA